MTLDGSPNFVVLASGAGRDKALARYEAKAGTRLMPDSHNAAKQTGSTPESALDGFSAWGRRDLTEPVQLPEPLSVVRGPNGLPPARLRIPSDQDEIDQRNQPGGDAAGNQGVVDAKIG